MAVDFDFNYNPCAQERFKELFTSQSPLLRSIMDLAVFNHRGTRPWTTTVGTFFEIDRGIRRELGG